MSLLILFGGGPPPSVVDETLRTFAANRCPANGFFDSEILETIKGNTQALVLSATGANLTAANLTVSQGHTHESAATRLAWKQISTYLLHNNAAPAIGAAPDECYDAALITGTTPTQLAYLRLWLDASQAADLIPRVRVSNDNSATTNCTITFDFYGLDLVLVATYSLVFSTATLRNRAWVNGVTQDLVAAGAVLDAVVTSRYPLICIVSGVLAANVEDVALHEVSFGVTP